METLEKTVSVADNAAFGGLCEVERIPASILARINFTPSGCWIWCGTLGAPGGYGQISFKRKLWRAHRLIWTFINGPIPQGLQVLHHCDVPRCVNAVDTAHHLFLGTDQDNHRDKAAKGRHWQQKKTHCPQGHPYSPENTYHPPCGGRKCRTCRGAK